MAVFGTSWRVGRVAGIEVRVDSSWVVIALLITYSMYLRLSVLYPELSGGGAVGLAGLSAVLFFGSVLVVQDGEVVGIITPSDLTRWLRRWRALESRAR